MLSPNKVEWGMIVFIVPPKASMEIVVRDETFLPLVARPTLHRLTAETTDQVGARRTHFPLGEYLVKTSTTGFAAAGLLTWPARISLASISFP
jgi:hypothetical protein